LTGAFFDDKIKGTPWFSQKLHFIEKSVVEIIIKMAKKHEKVLKMAFPK
jgi:hypothetical protein